MPKKYNASHHFARQTRVLAHRENKYNVKKAVASVKRQKEIAAKQRHPDADFSLWMLILGLMASKKSSSTLKWNFGADEGATVHGLHCETPMQFLSLLLLASTFVIPTQSCAVVKSKIHDIPVTKFTNKSMQCESVGTGNSGGVKCSNTKGQTFFLKPLSDCPPPDSLLEQYNRELASNCIGVRAPSTLFFYDQSNKQYYIGSKKIEGFVPADDFLSNPAAKRLADKNLSQYLVAATLIHDLHRMNWGGG